MWQKVKNIYHLYQAVFANIVYLFPSRGMIVIGVTGTDGKTTTSSLLYHTLVTAGYKTALISTNGAKINGKTSDLGFHVTTPGRFQIQSYFKRAKKAGVQYVVLEITSHALDQHRAWGIPITVGVLTNVTREHLDYHKTYENYVKTKAKLLKHAKIVVVNKDDRSYWQIRKNELCGKDRIVTYGMKKDADINPHVFPFTTKLIGQFNKYNCLAAISALRALAIPDDRIRKGIATFTPPSGRQEIVYNKQFTVMNDFAHTPGAFAVVLPEVRKLTSRRLIHVFGSAAKRDTFKRPEMGAIAAKYDDIIIVTAEDPRDEPVMQICKAIVDGIKDTRFIHVSESERNEVLPAIGKKYVHVIPDRQEAISFAIRIAQKDDVVLLTGKGHEKSINYGNGEEPWNETAVAIDALRARNLL